MMRKENNGLFTKVSGPLATVRACNFCKHVELVRTGGVGRGYGLTAGNQAIGRMKQHLKAAHPDAYAAHRSAA